PEYRKIDVDDVLVTGEHQALLRHVAHCGATTQILNKPHADIDAVDARDFRREHRFDGVWQVIIETGFRVAHVFAETQHHAELVRIDAEEARKSPDGDCGKRQQDEASAAEIPTRQYVAQLVLAAPQDPFEIGQCRSRLLRPRSPGSAALIARRHQLSPRYAISRGRHCWAGYRCVVTPLQRGPRTCSPSIRGITATTDWPLACN